VRQPAAWEKVAADIEADIRRLGMAYEVPSEVVIMGLYGVTLFEARRALADLVFKQLIYVNSARQKVVHEKQ
jgi:DNA-binding GntR family transcriptional regulator